MRYWPQQLQLVQRRIHRIGTFYSMSYSPGSVTGAGLAGIDPKPIRDQVHALNESV